MGRNIVGFLVGLIISALVFAAVAVIRTDDSVQLPPPELAAPKATPAPEMATPEPEMAEPKPEVTEPAPEAEVTKDPVMLEAPETAPPPPDAAAADPPAPERPEAEAEPPEVIETPPVVAAAPAAQTPPADATPQLEPKVAGKGQQAPLQEPVALTEAPPVPAPAESVPNPPVVIAPAEPEPAPAREPKPEPQQEPEPQAEPVPEQTAASDPTAPAAPTPEAEAPLDAAEPAEEPAETLVVRRARLPVVTDDTPSASIEFGRRGGSSLPSITGDVTRPLSVVTEAPRLRVAPPPVAAKRLTAPKSLRPDGNTTAVLTTEPAPPAATPEPAPKAAPDSRVAIDKFGVLFEDTAKPKLSIVLVDVGNGGAPLDTAATLDMPVTFAVAVDRADATLAAKRYVENGHEVLALSPRSVKLSLSGGQSKEQVAELLSEFFVLVPQSIGLLDVPEATLQNDRVLLRYVLEALQDTGHGMVTYAQGLNTAKREADKSGVPAGLIYRVIDQKGETAADIARYLDRAVTEAASTGHVIVLGSTRAATINAIRRWSESRTARNVVIAPVSASIKQN